jgi:septum formation protein
MNPPLSPPSRLILASASPRRRELLAQLGVPFEVVVANVTEHEDPATDPRVMVAHNAALKADWVAERTPTRSSWGRTRPCFSTAGHQQAAGPGRSALDAPGLSGREHTVFTGVAVRRGSTGLRIDQGSKARSSSSPSGTPVIEDYIRLVNTLDKAGPTRSRTTRT